MRSVTRTDFRPRWARRSRAPARQAIAGRPKAARVVNDVVHEDGADTGDSRNRQYCLEKLLTAGWFLRRDHGHFVSVFGHHLGKNFLGTGNTYGELAK